MTWLTFDQWSSRGYKINKGSKGTRFSDGIKFNETQVTYSPRPRPSGNHWKGCTPKGSFDHWGGWDDECELEYHELYGYGR